MSQYAGGALGVDWNLDGSELDAASVASLAGSEEEHSRAVRAEIDTLQRDAAAGLGLVKSSAERREELRRLDCLREEAARLPEPPPAPRVPLRVRRGQALLWIDSSVCDGICPREVVYLVDDLDAPAQWAKIRRSRTSTLFQREELRRLGQDPSVVREKEVLARDLHRLCPASTDSTIRTKLYTTYIRGAYTYRPPHTHIMYERLPLTHSTRLTEYQWELDDATAPGLVLRLAKAHVSSIHMITGGVHSQCTVQGARVRLDTPRRFPLAQYRRDGHWHWPTLLAKAECEVLLGRDDHMRATRWDGLYAIDSVNGAPTVLDRVEAMDAALAPPLTRYHGKRDRQGRRNPIVTQMMVLLGQSWEGAASPSEPPVPEIIAFRRYCAYGPNADAGMRPYLDGFVDRAEAWLYRRAASLHDSVWTWFQNAPKSTAALRREAVIRAVQYTFLHPLDLSQVWD
eukprot:gene6100-16658_t